MTSSRWCVGENLFITCSQAVAPAEAVGAIGMGTENIVNKIYTPIIHAIERLGTLDRKEYVFFELHCEVDDDHHEALLAIASYFAD